MKILKRPRAVLMNKSNKKPLLWSSLANKYRDDIVFFTHRDRRGKSSVKLGFEAGEENEPKILIYPPGETKPVQFQGDLINFFLTFGCIDSYYYIKVL